jgi:hypothetical protein
MQTYVMFRAAGRRRLRRILRIAAWPASAWRDTSPGVPATA